MAFLYKQATFIDVVYFIRRPDINEDAMLVQAKLTPGGLSAVAIHVKPCHPTFSATD